MDNDECCQRLSYSVCGATDNSIVENSACGNNKTIDENCSDDESTTFFSNYLGPSADETILSGVKTVLRMCGNISCGDLQCQEEPRKSSSNIPSIKLEEDTRKPCITSTSRPNKTLPAYSDKMGNDLHLVMIFMLAFSCITSSLALRNPPSDSILDIINMKEVQRIIAEKKENQTKEENRFLLDNDLNENYIPPEPEYEIQKAEEPPKTENPRIDIDVLLKRNNFTEPYRGTDLLQDLRGFNGRKVLKSSKNAVLVTKKEYLQRDWCKTEPLVQKIKEKGCLTRTMINRFCYGQCNSFYIPKNPKRRNRHRPVVEESEDEDTNGPAFKYCGFCKPQKYTWVTVTLKCPNMVPQYRKKRIQRIKQCSCLPGND
ncbi:unnamed protein product [Brassicogethes aeneus]|uniref:CTCK domain-containing protein n=1 Tax=Brassicogethes aeneus TaxID=1431903 RepID=A0A9P0BBI1_BRAAE|nr:unnamed protein product [Brassicogethes aeneus]